jgi:hypothetical protein
LRTRLASARELLRESKRESSACRRNWLKPKSNVDGKGERRLLNRATRPAGRASYRRLALRREIGPEGRQRRNRERGDLASGSSEGLCRCLRALTYQATKQEARQTHNNPESIGTGRGTAIVYRSETVRIRPRSRTAAIHPDKLLHIRRNSYRARA